MFGPHRSWGSYLGKLECVDKNDDSNDYSSLAELIYFIQCFRYNFLWKASAGWWMTVDHARHQEMTGELKKTKYVFCMSLSMIFLCNQPF
jgi:hypothetical protein